MMKKNRQTIVAISTPSGIGGVGMIRLSGLHALEIAKHVFQRNTQDPWVPNQLYFGSVIDPATQEKKDDGYAVYFQHPRSFTGEDVVELQLHGNPILLSDIVELCQTHGARLAEPGEFTKRAYLNGKMDLLQAEAVAELIHSQSLMEVRQARLRLDGKLSTHLENIRNEAIDVLAEIEANVDFPEEDIDVENQKSILSRIEKLVEISKSILQTYQQNQKITSGFRAVLIGNPNAGKSSLFNALLSHDRAIVTPHAGTTRDVLSEEILLNGFRVKLLDTAGLRKEFLDEIEKEGITRSSHEISKADLVLWIRSTTDDSNEHVEFEIKNVPPEKIWMVWNKIDLKKPHSEIQTGCEKEFFVSAKTEEGVPSLIQALRDKVLMENSGDFGGGISNDRHKELMTHIIESSMATMALLRTQEPPELVSAEFRNVFRYLGQILGKEDDLEAIYDRIFSKFCIGK